MNPVKFDSTYPIQQVNQSVVYIRAIVISMGGLFFGYNNGCFNPTQEHISNMNGWFSSFDVALYTGLITSFLPFGCMIGSLLSNQLMNITQSNLRICLAITDLIGLVGTIIQILDPNLGNFILGRFLSGIAGGFNTSIVPVYLSNFTPVIMRGKTGTFVQTFASLGLFIGLSLGAIQPRYSKVPSGEEKSTFLENEISNMESFEKNTAWRITIGLPIIMCCIRLFALIFIFKEDTPIQMVKHHHLKTLRKYLERCYDKDRADLRFKEIVEYAKYQNDDSEQNSEEEEDMGGHIHVEFGVHQEQKKEKKSPRQLISLQNQTEQNQQHHSESHHDTSNNEVLKAAQKHTENLEIKLAGNSGTSDEQAEKRPINKAGLKPTFKSQRRRKMLGVVAQMSAQLSGLNALMFFSSSIFKDNSDDPDTVQFYLYIQGFSIFFFTFIAIFFIERFGRKKLIMASTVLTMIGLFGIAIFALIDIFILSFIFIIFFLFGFGIGLGAVIWPYCAEVVNKEDLPFCTAIRWSCTLFIGICFRFIVLGIGVSGSFFMFFGFTLAAFIYFVKEMKETKGLTLEQVDELFAA